ncbi:aldo/keto reductase [Companilactobacillus futsaii]|uniref:Aldo/keto reductase n=2 Tax=Companilactobacillus futsaii TaxID=938155 RepID=A0A5B7T0N3_9LACO|nr:aldo/keto reductase [Companilactobacillus futsaii]KRK99148.1 aldo keto reductase [Companilactobacillus futsaii JCM 17355]QCX24150.1 aldo/keto reductase [Companilactobacillus futsaii]
MNLMQEDLKMPKVALGTWAWGESKSANKVFGNSLTANDLEPIFNRGMELGLNLWDTAAVYNDGDSEAILGKFIKGIDRDKVILSTKFTPQIADGSEKAVENMFDGSANRLNTNFVDIYWIHNDADVDKWTREIVPLAKEGKIKYIGISNHNLEEIKRANEILHEAGFKISAVQNHFSILDRTSETSGIIDYCKENDINFFSYMVLEQGALSGKYDTKHPFPKDSERAEVYNDKLDKLESLINGMREIAQKHNVDVAQIPTAWAVAKNTIPIIGATKVKHIEDAAKASEVKLTASEVAKLDELGNKTAIDTTRVWEQNM